MKKLLVVGCGLLGSKAMQLGRSKYEVYGTHINRKEQGYITLDVRDRNMVFGVINNIKPDIVFDSHVMNDMDYAENHREEMWEINVDGSRNVAEASKAVGAKYIFISSECLFDGKRNIYLEYSKPSPLNYFGRGKWASEMLLEVLGIDSIIARTSGLYGLSSSSGKRSFIQFITDNLKNNVETKVITDQYSSPTLVDDLVTSIFKLYEKKANGVFNIVGRDCITKYDYALQIAKTFNLDKTLIKPCLTSEINQVAKRPVKVLLSTKKLQWTIGKTPMGIIDGLKLIKKGSIV